MKTASPLHPDWVKFWQTNPQLQRVSLAARALWLLMAIQPKPRKLSEIAALSGLSRLESNNLIAELMVEHLVEHDGISVVCDPRFTVLPRAGLPPPLQHTGIDWLDNRKLPGAVH